MANNQITPFQLTDQFTMDNFNQRINETNTALQNNDPRNWALGITANSLKNEINRLSVVDETISNGWYLVYLSDGGNIGGATQGTLSVDASSRGITQEFRFYYAGYGGFCKLTRIKPYQEEWQPWEYVNPPMRLGVEYRTTERHNGKPVYKMAIPWPTAFPHTATHQVEVASLKYDDISIIGIDCTAKAAVSKQTQKLPIMKEDGSGTVAAYTNVERYSNGSVLVQITSTIDMTEWLVNSLVICYTKN